MLDKKEKAVATTTASKKKLTTKSYQPAYRWSSSMDTLLGTLLLTSQHPDFSRAERRDCLEQAARLLQTKANLGLIGRACCHA
jgi:23S rRNA maturation mini-RNase III